MLPMVILQARRAMQAVEALSQPEQLTFCCEDAVQPFFLSKKD